jgi:hypothetical protein
MSGRAGLERRIAAALAGYPRLTPPQRRVLGTLLAFPAERWRVYAGPEWPDDPDLVLVGPPGVSVLGLAGAEHVEQALATSRLSPVAVRAVPVWDGAGARPLRELAGRPAVLTASHVAALGGLLARAGYRRLDLPAPKPVASEERRAGGARGWRRAPGPAATVRETQFDAEALAAAERDGPVAPEWLSFLDQRQLDVVRRDYPGPAWISGPAGTGKTVVALHRMARLARRGPGRLLYVTFVRNLPLVASAAFRQLAPESAPRADFTNVHAWARDLLLRRGLGAADGRAAADGAYDDAWSRVGARGRLAVLARDPAYWRDEVDHVIKGGGLTAPEQYLRLPRRGRRLRLDEAARTAMWQLYEEYELRRRERGGMDHNDLLLAAAAELERAPLDPPYAVVVADEAQDMTRVGLRLLHALAGDRPNGLLLVGDGEQAVYPAGSSLSETGIPLRGRGDVLRVNYRNTVEVLAVARQLGAVNRFDADAALALRDVQATLPGGAAQHYTASTAEDHDVELVTALRTCRVAPGDIALLTRTPEAASHYRQVLHAAQIPAINLADYAGRRTDAVKVGTIRWAKGLEFRAVFLPGCVAGGDEIGVREALVGLTRARDFVWTGSVVGG